MIQPVNTHDIGHELEALNRIGDTAWAAFTVLREYDPGTLAPTTGPRWTHVGGYMAAARLELDRWRQRLQFRAPGRYAMHVWCTTAFNLDGYWSAGLWPNTVLTPETRSIYTNVNTLTLVSFVPTGTIDRRYHFRRLDVTKTTSSSTSHRVNIVGNETTATVLLIRI